MLVQLRFNESGMKDMTVQLHGELPKAGAIIEFEEGLFAVSAAPTTWVCADAELVPVLHVLPKTEAVPA